MYQGQDFQKFDYYAVFTQLVSVCFDIYVDLFLLWLLYKFMRPQIILSDGKTQASTLLFAHAHNSISLIECSDESYKPKNPSAFFTYMLKILTEGLRTESSIFDEFMDSSDRSHL